MARGNRPDADAGVPSGQGERPEVAAVRCRLLPSCLALVARRAKPKSGRSGGAIRRREGDQVGGGCRLERSEKGQRVQESSDGDTSPDTKTGRGAFTIPERGTTVSDLRGGKHRLHNGREGQPRHPRATFAVRVIARHLREP